MSARSVKAVWGRTARVGVAIAGWLTGMLGVAPSAHASSRFPAGALEEFRIPSRQQGRERRVWVYAPPGYAAARDTSLGWVVAFDGREYQDEIPLPHMLDSLTAAGTIPPLVAILVDDSTGAARLDDLANRAWFADFIADEVFPWARARWHLSADPRHALVTGSSAGGLAAVYIALRRPDRFGNALSQSGAFWRGNEASNVPPYEWLTSDVARAPRKPVRLWLEVGTTENRGALGGAAPSILAANRTLRDTLRVRGYDLTYIEVPNGVHSHETWAPRLPAGIVGLMGRHAAPR